jgi:hypothetical protein
VPVVDPEVVVCVKTWGVYLAIQGSAPRRSVASVILGDGEDVADGYVGRAYFQCE